MRGRARLLVAVLLLLLAVPCGAADFYVDAARTSNGSGTAASPWKARSDIDWAAISTALNSGSVTVYFSSRATWSTNEYIQVPASTNSTSNRLTLDGHALYNLTTTGTAAWIAESVTGNRATTANAGGTGGTILIRNPNAYITVQGFLVDHPSSGGIYGGADSAPTTNLHDITVVNNVIDTPASGHGVWFGFNESGCYNITVSANTIQNTPLEPIYMGHYNYLSPTMTGTVVEYNTVINPGVSVQGDIDIKAPNFGAIVRYNTFYGTGTGGWSGCVTAFASDVQIYGNTCYTAAQHDDGLGIMISGAGDAATAGFNIANVIVYNNVIYTMGGVAGHGIAVYSGTGAYTGTISNLQIINNTVVSNGGNGLLLSASGSKTITVSALHNNIFSNNTTYAVNSTSASDTITSANNNLYYNSGTLTLAYRGANKTYAQWQAIGFDAAGVNANPLLDSAYAPQVGSPAIDAASTRTEFSVDRSGAPRTGAWDIGAFEYGASIGVGSKGRMQMRTQ